MLGTQTRLQKTPESSVSRINWRKCSSKFLFSHLKGQSRGLVKDPQNQKKALSQNSSRIKSRIVTIIKMTFTENPVKKAKSGLSIKDEGQNVNSERGLKIQRNLN